MHEIAPEQFKQSHPAKAGIHIPVFEIWSLGIEICLIFGFWDLEFGSHSCRTAASSRRTVVSFSQMRYAILADIHANLEALTAVLADIDRRGGADGYWVLGDLVNYGPDPGACIKILRSLPLIAVSGNHDLAAAGKMSAAFFNADAAAALDWTTKQLSMDDVEFLRSLPEMVEREGFTLVHGSPRGPATEYLLSITAARQNFGLLATRHALAGHTHLPAAFKLEDSGNVRYLPFTGGISLSLVEGRYIINPGSAGQPRDGDPRASYAIYDSGTSAIQLHRVEYDIKATQDKMLAAGLPSHLIARLEIGR